MELNIQKTKYAIPKFLFWLSLIILVTGFFYSPKWIFNLGLIFNLILLGTFFIIDKYGFMFDSMIGARKVINNFARKL